MEQMNSLIKQTSRLVVLTLIAGLLVMPTYPVWAEDLVETPTLETTPIAETVSTEPSEIVPVDQTVVTDPTVSLDLTTVAESPLAEPVAVVEMSVLVTSKPTVDSELDFTTASDPIAPSDSLAISDEFEAIGVIPLIDNLAISDELNLETAGEPLIDNAEISWELNFTTLPVGIDNLAVSEENGFTLPNAPVDTLAVSAESSFSTQAVPVDKVAISGELSFTTQVLPIDNPVVSGELSFNTLPATTDTLAVSSELSFITETGDNTGNPAVSNEFSFNTLSVPVGNLAISDELSFTTLAIPIDTLSVSNEMSFTTASAPVDNLSVSAENSFTTLANPSDTLAVSDEQNFTTENSTNPPVNPPGGGGGGGSGGSVVPVPYVCSIFLKQFIKYGEANNRFEVIKLQVFLRVFEGFKNLKVTGIYDRATYEAVKVFQKRYTRDVLRPWGIDDSTGYVYITTRLAINNIFCGRDTKTNLRFYEELEREYQQVTGDWGLPVDDGGYYLVPTTTASTSPVTQINFLLAGIGNLLDFISANFCWLLNLLLLLLILFLLWLLWLASRDKEEERIEDQIVGAVPLEELLTSADEKALGAIIDEAEEQLPAANNNPEQETILLGPETLSDLDKETEKS